MPKFLDRFFRWWGRNTTFESVAQTCHAALGALSVAIPVALHYGWRVWCTTGTLMLVCAAWKEGWFDPRYETPETAGSGVVDWTSYFAGVAAMWVLFTVCRAKEIFP